MCTAGFMYSGSELLLWVPVVKCVMNPGDEYLIPSHGESAQLKSLLEDIEGSISTFSS